MKKIIVMILGLILLINCLVGCKNQSEGEMDEIEFRMDCIYIGHGSHGQMDPEYKIDLVNQKWWLYTTHSVSEYTPRDSSKRNEGFYFIEDLQEEKIAAFLLACENANFDQWKGRYEPKDVVVMDGHYWYIKIIYSDETEKIISGKNAYPDTWNEINRALEDLTGYPLLGEAMPTPTFWFFGRPVYWW